MIANWRSNYSLTLKVWLVAVVQFGQVIPLDLLFLMRSILNQFHDVTLFDRPYLAMPVERSTKL